VYAFVEHNAFLQKPKLQYYYQLILDIQEILWYIDFGQIVKSAEKTLEGMCKQIEKAVETAMRILESTYAEIIESCPAVPPEVGGILGCRDGIICEYVLDFNEKAAFTEQAVYIPRTDFLNAHIAAWARDQIRFCGMFHSHLPWERELSCGDREYIRTLLLAMPNTISQLYVPLVIENRPVTMIGNRAFEGYDLTYVYIPDSVTTIDWGAFLDCAQLKEVRMPKKLKCLESVAFKGCTSLTEIDIPSAEEICREAFNGCKKLQSVKLPKNLRRIGELAFYKCPMLRKLSLPDSLNQIDDSAFDGMNLQELTLPDHVTYFSYYSDTNHQLRRRKENIADIESNNVYDYMETILDPMDKFCDDGVIIYVRKGSDTERVLTHYNEKVDEAIEKYGARVDSGWGQEYILEEYKIPFKIK